MPVLGCEELTDLRNVRLEVEALAVRWAVQNRDEAFLSDLDEHMALLEETERVDDTKGHIKANYGFHLRIYHQSKSAVLIDVINSLWLRVSPHLYQLEGEGQYKDSNKHHRKIIEMIHKGDAQGASEALANDLSDGYDVLVRKLGPPVYPALPIYRINGGIFIKKMSLIFDQISVIFFVN